MNNFTANILVSIGILLHSTVIFGQVDISTHTRTELQVGNLPHTKPADLTATYSQFNTGLIYGDFIGGVRGEFFNSSYEQPDFHRINVTQRYVKWQKGPVAATAGNFYGILGRGLTYRAFELAGVINEDFSFRRRYALSRDTDGFLVKASTNRFEATALYGKPLMVDFPPGNSDLDQRNEEIHGGEAKFHPFSSLTVGTTYVNLRNADTDLSSGYIGYVFTPDTGLLGVELLYFDVYGEYAQANGSFSQFLSFNTDRPYAAYVMSNILIEDVGFSIEYKDYNDFLYRLNDPPSLIREHSWVLLNRATHVLRSSGEHGLQIEAYYALPGENLFVANYSQADIESFFGDQRFYEYFAEVDLTYSRKLTGKYSFDYAKDISQQEKDRITFGTLFEYLWTDTWSMRLSYEWQRLERLFSPEKPRFTNMYGSAGFSVAPDLSVGVSIERSTDFLETDDPDTEVNEFDPKYWLGFFAGYNVLDRYDVNFFAGTRRGGPACTAGTCYEVLSFRGAELRVTTQL